MPPPRRVAYFVTPHGFGHAARAAAVVAALRERLSSIEVELWTTVPRWFFEESLDFPFTYREFSCDVGLVQKSPVTEDLPATVAALERLWSGDDRKARTREAGSALVASGIELVLCDIAPFGLAAASSAGLPSVLFENFTWDWIYEPLVASEPRLAAWVGFLGEQFARADLRIQLDPSCAPAERAPSVSPIARRTKRSAGEVRERLRVAEGSALVLVTLGGVEHRLANVEALRAFPQATFVVLGASGSEELHDNVRLLPHHAPVYHPDLVAAADLVVGKLGYSTVAEAVAAGTRMLYVPRPTFRESAVLEAYVRERLPAEAMTMDDLESGRWARRVAALLARERPAPRPSTGAAEAAALVAAAVL